VFGFTGSKNLRVLPGQQVTDNWSLIVVAFEAKASIIQNSFP
jgi:hypothetical protein